MWMKPLASQAYRIGAASVNSRTRKHFPALLARSISLVREMPQSTMPGRKRLPYLLSKSEPRAADLPAVIAAQISARLLALITMEAVAGAAETADRGAAAR